MQGNNTYTEPEYTALMTAVMTSNKPVVETLLTQHEDIEHQDASGRTALLLAVAKGYSEIAELLLNAGAADIDRAMEYGYTPLMIAVQNKDARMVQLLLKHKANIYAR